METVEQIAIANGDRTANIRIVFDPDPDNPRNWDNLGKMICFHRRYSLGDEHPYKHVQFTGWDHMNKHLSKDHIAIPLYLYDHGGITMSTTPFNCPWDSGQLGFIVASKDKVRSEYNVKAITPAIRKKVIQVLLCEVDTYNKYLAGQVYGYIVELDGDKESCFGYYDADDAKAEAEAMAHAMMETQHA